MKRTITKTELRKNIFHTEGGSRIALGFYIDDEPYFLAYGIDDFDYAFNFETLAINKFINEDLNRFHGKELNEKHIEIYYRKKRIA